MFNLTESDKKWIDDVWAKADNKLKKVAVRSREKIPYTTINGVHDNMAEKDICWWTNGFWPGLMWLMYVDTKNDVYKETAERAEELLDGAFENYEGLHHDVGFTWLISSGVNYRLFNNQKSKIRTLYAANILSSRYNIKGEFIRAWNHDCYGWAIIDCMMNIPLLYWASKEIDDPRYKYIAEAHANKTMENHVRPDGSVNHIVVYDHLEGAGMIDNLAGQGYEVGSSWSRGQSWAIYGYILSYIHTGKQEYLDTAKRVAHYFISCVCDDWLPKCDFRSPTEPVIYDTTAGACAACGLIEIARCVPEHEKKVYLNAALKLLTAMEEKFCNWEDDEDSILQMGTEAYRPREGGKHIPIIYGDYYFIEALYKLRDNDMLFW
ncbi:MAG: glycoside hydrolase family 88 protein [Oscillospiraceae bacterium]